MFPKALILSVGTTKDPLIKAIDEFIHETGLVVLIYGKGFPGQEPNPFDITADVKKYCRDNNLHVELYEVSNPEDIDNIINCCKKVFRELVERFNIREIIVNYSGGTKPMAAGLVYSALTCPYNIDIILEYVGGKVRDKFGRVVMEAMKIRRSVKTQYSSLRDRIIEYAGKYAYPQALAISELLPESGTPGFLRKSIKALYYWDNFNYNNAKTVLNELSGADILNEYDEYKEIADTVSRLRSIASRIAYLDGELRKLNSNPKDKYILKKIVNDPKGLILLSLDAYENAYRRLIEGRYADAVLRVYRSIESLVQSLLMLKLRIAPWKVDWEDMEKEEVEQIKNALDIDKLPENIGLYQGLKILELHLGKFISWDKITTIMQLRNYSHLEHGYIEIDKEKAEKSLNIAGDIIKELTIKTGIINETELTNLRKKLRYTIT